MWLLAIIDKNVWSSIIHTFLLLDNRKWKIKCISYKKVIYFTKKIKILALRANIFNIWRFFWCGMGLGACWILDFIFAHIHIYLYVCMCVSSALLQQLYFYFFSIHAFLAYKLNPKKIQARIRSEPLDPMWTWARGSILFSLYCRACRSRIKIKK